ncbi:MAG: hypothetical protein R3B07_29640 [Polyangiaceae bacterium]
MSPGAGTEVFGDEAGLRRMLQVLVTRTHRRRRCAPNLSSAAAAAGSTSAWELGPDHGGYGQDRVPLAQPDGAAPHGGRLELEGGIGGFCRQTPAQRERMTELRRELEQAQQLGEAYARAGSGLRGRQLPDQPHKRLATSSSALVALSTALNPAVAGSPRRDP